MELPRACACDPSAPDVAAGVRHVLRAPRTPSTFPCSRLTFGSCYIRPVSSCATLAEGAGTGTQDRTGGRCCCCYDTEQHGVTVTCTTTQSKGRMTEIAPRDTGAPVGFRMDIGDASVRECLGVELMAMLKYIKRVDEDRCLMSESNSLSDKVSTHKQPSATTSTSPASTPRKALHLHSTLHGMSATNTMGDHEKPAIAKRSGEHHEHEAGFETPPIDWETAATLRPSKLKGNGLTWMVTFVAGTGVSFAHLPLSPNPPSQCAEHTLTRTVHSLRL